MILFALFGIAYGVVLQRSGFCFARAAFELFLLRTREAVNGVMAALLVTTIGFGAVTLVKDHVGLADGNDLLLLPVGLSTILGAMLFGLGMMLAGMCAAGTLQRAGEGYASALAVLVGIPLGAALDPFAPLRHAAPALTGVDLSLTQWMDPRLGFALTVAAILLLWVALSRRSGDPVPDLEPSPTSRRGRLRSYLAPAVVGGLLLGLLNTAQLATVGPWTVGYPLALIPSLFAGGHSHGSLQNALPLLVLDGGLLLGAVLSAALAGGLRFRWPRQSRDLAMALAGGVLMGWGIQTAHACNIGGILSAIPSLSLSGWVFLPSVLFGAWLGAKLFARLG